MLNSIKENDKIVIIFPSSLQGENAWELKDTIESAINEGNKLFVLDAVDLTYMTSRGISVLVKVLLDYRGKYEELYIRNVRPNIKELFKITAVDQICSIHDLQPA